MTVTERIVLPPAPLQVSVKVLDAESAPVDWLPEVARVPDQPPEAVQEVALVEDHVSVDDPPLATEVGFAASDTVGATGVTVTVADALWVPPNPVQERLKLLVVVNEPVDWLPEVAFEAVPHAPEEVQDVAFVEDQVRVDDPPLGIDEGLTPSDTVGAGGGGGVPDTVTVVDTLALPPEPVQVSEKLLLAKSAPVVWLPEVALAPDHAPEAEQDDVLVEVQVSIEVAPLWIDVGLAASDTVGAVGAVVGADAGAAVPPPQDESIKASTGTSSEIFLRDIGILNP